MEKSEPRANVAPQSRSRPARRRLIGSRLFVRVAVGLSILLAASMVASLYIHWRRVQEPSTAILIVADPTWNGAKVIVTPAGDDSPLHRIQVTLDEYNQYKTPVFGLPGRYEVKVMLHDRKEWDRTVEIDHSRGSQIDLPTFVEVIGDSTLDGGQVLISSKDDSYPGVLSADNKFRLVVPLYAGDYSLEVTRGGQVLDHSEFAITPHAPRQIDLRKR
jgi:hypothetical protein